MNESIIFTNNKPHEFDGYAQALNAICFPAHCSNCGEKCPDIEYNNRLEQYVCIECNYNFNEGWIAQYEI